MKESDKSRLIWEITALYHDLEDLAFKYTSCADFSFFTAYFCSSRYVSVDKKKMSF